MGLSTIQWTDYTFNPWIGCRKVAPECANCYAETLDRNRYSKTLAPGTKENPVSHWGGGPRHRTKTWGDPLKWNRKAGQANEIYQKECEDFSLHQSERLPKPDRPRVFCASLADWLDDENVPIEWFADLLRLIRDTPNLDWLLLTKRPQNWRERISAVIELLNASNKDEETKLAFWVWNWLKDGKAPANVWIGVSAGADQQAALAIPARVHFLSCEPMLNPLEENKISAAFDWTIFGGESGSNARPCKQQWIRDGIAFCLAHGVAPFVKQMGSNSIAPETTEANWRPFKDSHGGDMDEWPEDLRVREFPTVH